MQVRGENFVIFVYIQAIFKAKYFKEEIPPDVKGLYFDSYINYLL